MKKFIFAVAPAVLILGLAACGGKPARPVDQCASAIESNVSIQHGSMLDVEFAAKQTIPVCQNLSYSHLVSAVQQANNYVNQNGPK